MNVLNMPQEKDKFLFFFSMCGRMDLVLMRLD